MKRGEVIESKIARDRIEITSVLWFRRQADGAITHVVPQSSWSMS